MRLIRWIRVTILAAVVLVASPASSAQVLVSVTIAPPALPVYEQPFCPEEGYIWTPGYWAYGPDGYYWVPGTWVPAPEPGLLWTPGFWGWGFHVALGQLGLTTTLMATIKRAISPAMNDIAPINTPAITNPGLEQLPPRAPSRSHQGRISYDGSYAEKHERLLQAEWLPYHCDPCLDYPTASSIVAKSP